MSSTLSLGTSMRLNYTSRWRYVSQLLPRRSSWLLQMTEILNNRCYQNKTHSEARRPGQEQVLQKKSEQNADGKR